MKVYLFPNLDKSNCLEYTTRACEILSECGIEIYMSENYIADFGNVQELIFGEENECIMCCDIIIAIGGDGTILKCSLKACKFNKPVLGINCGRLGFMAAVEHSQLDWLKKLANGEYTLSKRMMLEIYVDNPENKDIRFTALNDVVVSKSDDCKIADFEVAKDRQNISSLRADGVIFSTATGATAYSMSAGGPIIEPEMECIEFTQICPHSLFARSMILSADSVLSVKCHTNNKSHVYVNVDGNIVYRLTDGEQVIVSKSEYYVKIIDIKGGSFFNSVNTKLMQPLKDISEEIQQ